MQSINFHALLTSLQPDIARVNPYVPAMKIVLLFALAFWASTSALLSREYKFSVSLNDDDTYRLHWTIDNSKGTINVGIETKTTGWIGFGLSPDGKMPNSDIVTGWVKDEKGFLQVHVTKTRPRIPVYCTLRYS